jgi:hypothetical protein
MKIIFLSLLIILFFSSVSSAAFSGVYTAAGCPSDQLVNVIMNYQRTTVSVRGVFDAGYGLTMTSDYVSSYGRDKVLGLSDSSGQVQISYLGFVPSELNVAACVVADQPYKRELSVVLGGIFALCFSLAFASRFL